MGSNRRRSFVAFTIALAALVAAVSASLVLADTGTGESQAPTAKPGAFNLHGQTLPKNSVGSKQIKNKQVKHADLGRNAVHPENICPDCAGGPQVKEATLGKVPSAATADHATQADNASHADKADKADVADKLSSQTIFSRHQIPTTGACSSNVICMPDGGNIEPLAQIGPIHVDGICRITGANGDGGGRSTGEFEPGGRNSGTVMIGNGVSEREAQIVVWSETGTLSFSGRNGPRTNLAAGPIDYTAESGVGTTNTSDNPGTVPNDDPVAGEGNHLFLATSNETADESRPVPGSNAAITGTNPTGLIYPALSSVPSGWIALDDPAIDLTFTGMAGFGILGIDPDRCVFSGLIQKL